MMVLQEEEVAEQTGTYAIVATRTFRVTLSTEARLVTYGTPGGKPLLELLGEAEKQYPSPEWTIEVFRYVGTLCR